VLGIDISGRSVIVTGAAGNLGRCVAQTFAACGADVALLDLDAGKLASVGLPGGCARLDLAVDLRAQDQVRAAVDRVVDRFGRIDCLCNIAGAFRMGEAVHETSEETWQFMHDVNVRSVLNTSRAVVPHMLRAGKGKIVNVAAQPALRGGARMSAYSVAKSAVIRLTESLSAETREKGINVNCILPSIIDTPENRAAMPDFDFAKWVMPQQVANLVAFLSSDLADGLHGAAVPIVGLS